MDTHISPDRALAGDDDGGAARQARLPGEHDGAPDTEHAAWPEAVPLRANPRPASVTPSKRQGRQALLVGVAASALVAIGASAFLLSTYNQVVPVPRQVSATVRDLEARAGIGADQPLAPSAALASVKLPPAPQALIEPKYVAQSPNAALSEVMQFRAGAGQSGVSPTATPATAPSPRMAPGDLPIPHPRPWPSPACRRRGSRPAAGHRRGMWRTNQGWLLNGRLQPPWRSQRRRLERPNWNTRWPLMRLRSTRKQPRHRRLMLRRNRPVVISCETGQPVHPSAPPRQVPKAGHRRSNIVLQPWSTTPQPSCRRTRLPSPRSCGPHR